MQHECFKIKIYVCTRKEIITTKHKSWKKNSDDYDASQLFFGYLCNLTWCTLEPELGIQFVYNVVSTMKIILMNS